MVVAAGTGPLGQKQVIIGLTEGDVDELRHGLTKVKQGDPLYGFHTLVVFMGKNNQEMLATLSQAGTVRRDDKFPNAGQG